MARGFGPAGRWFGGIVVTGAAETLPVVGRDPTVGNITTPPNATTVTTTAGAHSTVRIVDFIDMESNAVT